MNNTTDFDYFNTLLVQSVGSKVGPIAPTITPSAGGRRDDRRTGDRVGDHRPRA